MKLKYNTKFLNSIVQSEFFFKDNSYREKSFANIYKNKPFFSTSDLFSLSSELKQLIRIMRFLYFKSFKSCLYLYLQNTTQYFILQRYFNRFKNLSRSLVVANDHFFFKSIKKKSYVNMLLSFVDLKTFNLINAALSHNLLLSGLIYFSSQIARNTFFYRVNNKLDNNKKFFFMISLIQHILRKLKTRHKLK